MQYNPRQIACGLTNNVSDAAGSLPLAACLGAFHAVVEVHAVGSGLHDHVIAAPGAAADAFDGRSVTFSQPFVDLLKRARSEQRGIGDKLLGVDHIALAICGCTDPHLKGIGELGVVLSAVRPGQYTS